MRIAPRIQRAAGIACAALFCLAASTTFAQRVVPDRTGEADRRKRHRAPVTSIVLTSEEIRSTPAQTLDDVLRSVAGVTMPEQGSLIRDPAGNDAGLRGALGGAVLVLVDGVPINDAFFGGAHWLRIPVEQIERIEVVHGSQAARYAMHAQAGAILVSTRRPRTDSFEVQGAFGRFLNVDENRYPFATRNHNAGRANLLASKGLGRAVRATLHANVNGTKGYWQTADNERSLTELSASTANLRLEYTPVSGRTTAFLRVGAAALLPRIFPKPTDIGNPEPGRFDTRTAELTAGFSRAGLAGGVLETQLSYTDTRRRRRGQATDFFTPGTERTPSRDGGLSSVWTRTFSTPAKPHTVSIGGDLRAIESSMRLDLRATLRPGIDRAGYASDGTTRMAGMFVQSDWTAHERLTVRTALRVGGFQSDGWRYVDSGRVSRRLPSQTLRIISPTVAVAYAVSPVVTLRGSVFSGADAPWHSLISPLYSFSGQPESIGSNRLVGGDLGIDVLRGPLTLRVNLFQQQWRSDDSDEELSPEVVAGSFTSNISRGIETSVEWQSPRLLSARASYTRTSYQIPPPPYDPAFPGLPQAVTEIQAPDVPTHALSGLVRVQLPLRAHALLRARYTAYSSDGGFVLPDLTNIAVMDAALSVPLNRGFELFLRGENVLNRRYSNVQAYALTERGAPRLLTVGVRVDAFPR
jgi:outer membrane receptor protein involved in Fe transport